MPEVLTIRDDSRTKGRLERRAKQPGSFCSWLAADAVRACMDIDERRAVQIKTGLQAASAGNFASDAEVNAVESRGTRVRQGTQAKACAIKPGIRH